MKFFDIEVTVATLNNGPEVIVIRQELPTLHEVIIYISAEQVDLLIEALQTCKHQILVQ